MVRAGNLTPGWAPKALQDQGGAQDSGQQQPLAGWGFLFLLSGPGLAFPRGMLQCQRRGELWGVGLHAGPGAEPSASPLL